INPARTFASALPAGNWSSWWLYLIAPVAGMLTGVELYRLCWPGRVVRRAKLVWCDKQRCIHSGYVPGDTTNAFGSDEVRTGDANTRQENR
ncbi:MAG: aquaporin, partial [Gammaproteobacteria bacterium]